MTALCSGKICTIFPEKGALNFWKACTIALEYSRTIGEKIAEARQQSGAEKLKGHDIMALERFDPDVRHMIVFDVLSYDSPVGDKGDKMRLFLTDAGYQKFLESQERGEVKLKNHAKVSGGHLHYDHRDHAL